MSDHEVIVGCSVIVVLPKPRRHTREGMIMKEAETVANLAYAISEGVHDFVNKAVPQIELGLWSAPSNALAAAKFRAAQDTPTSCFRA
jgi:hypothetical protein